MEVEVWLKSHRLIIVLATLFTLGAVIFAISGLWGVDEIPPGATIAFLGIAAIGVAAFVISLPVARAFRHGRAAQIVAKAVITLVTRSYTVAQGSLSDSFQ